MIGGRADLRNGDSHSRSCPYVAAGKIDGVGSGIVNHDLAGFEPRIAIGIGSAVTDRIDAWLISVYRSIDLHFDLILPDGRSRPRFRIWRSEGRDQDGIAFQGDYRIRCYKGHMRRIIALAGAQQDHGRQQGP